MLQQHLSQTQNCEQINIKTSLDLKISKSKPAGIEANINSCISHLTSCEHEATGICY